MSFTTKQSSLEEALDGIMEGTTPNAPKNYTDDVVEGVMAVLLLIIIIAPYIFYSIYTIGRVADKAWAKYPNRKRDCGFIILGVPTSIILGFTWPIWMPFMWFITSDWSCFGFNYKKWRENRKEKKEQRAREIELERMQSAQRLQDEQVRRQNEDLEAQSREFAAAQVRVSRKIDALLGRGAGSTSPSASASSSSSRDEIDIEAVAGLDMSDATVSSARGGNGINGSPSRSRGDESGYIVVPRPVVVSSYPPRNP